MIQGSQEWHDFRRKGIGASEWASILGLSPYQTPLQLWRVKVGLDQQEIDNPAIYHGRKFEPKARACFELMSFKEYEPKVFQSEQHPYLYCSLDGWNVDDREILEIKCPGKNTLELAKNGQLPPHYYAQAQAQLYVSDGSRVLYFAFDPTIESGHIVTVVPDLVFLEQAVPKIISFWKLIQKKKEPPVTDRDYVPFPPEMEGICNMYRLQKFSGMFQDALRTRKRIIELMTHPRMKGFGITAYPSGSFTTIRFDDLTED